MEKQDFTKYERARIIGARALQIAMNAPLLIKISSEELEKLNFDAIRIAERNTTAVQVRLLMISSLECLPTSLLRA